MRDSRRNMLFSLAVLAAATPQLAMAGSPFTPVTIRQAYGFNALSGTGVGQTLALVEVGTSVSLQSDLNQFDTQYGLPAVTVSVVNEPGATVSAATSAQAQAAALDLEYAHAIAPGATLVVVDSVASLADELKSAQFAGTQASVVSINASYPETGTTADSFLTSSSTAFVTPTGDHGAPASSPRTRRSPWLLGALPSRPVPMAPISQKPVHPPVVEVSANLSQLPRFNPTMV